jgi:hypothetical protein
MVTTRGNLACLLLDTLASTGLEYAVLYGEDRIAQGQPDADVDVAVAVAPQQVVRSLAPMLAASRLVLGLVWRPDIGALTSLWLVAPGPDGAQLDLVCDPDGQGRYGLRTGALLQRRVRGRCWWRLDGPAERLCVLARCAVREDRAGLAGLPRVEPGERRVLARLSEQLLSDCRRSRVLRLLEGGSAPAGGFLPLPVRAPGAHRPVGRTRRGVGCWVTLAGDPSGEVMRRLHGSFARVLPRARILDAVAPMVVLQAHLERRNAGLAISRPVPGVRPDLALRAAEPRLTGRILGCLAQRADRTLRAMELADHR